MKKLIVILLIFITVACGTLNNTPNWQTIGSDKTAVELCCDTVSYKDLDSLHMIHHLNPNLENWTKMTFYGDSTQLEQYLYTLGPDTLYTITKENDKYIFVMRINK